MSDYDKKKEDIQLSYESFVEEKARLEYTLNKIKEETGKKKLEKLFTKIDNELTKFENNQFFTHFIVQSIRVEHDLLIQKINRVAKKETTDKKKEIIQMFRGYNASLTTVLVKLVLVLQEEGILNNGNAKTERNLV
ncbi:hypothetical protein [Halolactibacillus sp. JCM 19043]|uniref:hypothetical protein n=1 Tax=Halolactibacillus sp. JCM 19043 TaxID=1460638 RepID=UPI0007853B90|nr:hypothetical protein [Halolactibacillus sp. JCM 19043]